MFGKPRSVALDLSKTPPFDPSVMGSGWRVCPLRSDFRAQKLAEFHIADLVYQQKRYKMGYDKLDSLVSENLLRLDARWLLAMIDEPSQSHLRALQMFGVSHIDAFGTILVDPVDQTLSVLYAYLSTFHWNLARRDLSLPWEEHHVTACIRL